MAVSHTASELDLKFPLEIRNATVWLPGARARKPDEAGQIVPHDSDGKSRRHAGVECVSGRAW